MRGTLCPRGAGGYGGRRAGAGNHRAGRFRTHAGPFPPCGGHPAHVRCGKRRSCSGRVHRLSRQPGPGRGGHRQLRGHGHPAAHLLCAGIPPRSGGKWSCPSIWKTMRTSPARARHSCGAARAERPICFICPSARAAAARCAWTENCAAAAQLPRGRCRRRCFCSRRWVRPGAAPQRETLEDAVCLAALERRFGAALRDGAQPGEASAQACGTICAAR